MSVVVEARGRLDCHQPACGQMACDWFNHKPLANEYTLLFNATVAKWNSYFIQYDWKWICIDAMLNHSISKIWGVHDKDLSWCWNMETNTNQAPQVFSTDGVELLILALASKYTTLNGIVLFLNKRRSEMLKTWTQRAATNVNLSHLENTNINLHVQWTISYTMNLCSVKLLRGQVHLQNRNILNAAV